MEVNKKDPLSQNALQNYVANTAPIQKEVVFLASVAGEIINRSKVKKKDQQNKIVFVDVSMYLFRTVNVLDLHITCGDAIRKHLIDIGPPVNLFCKVPRLPLPSKLKDYLLYELYASVKSAK